MFHNSESLTQSIIESINENKYWNYSKFSIAEFITQVIEGNEPAYPELLNYAPLKGEFIIGSYNHWYVVTNYRFTLKLEAGQYSIPLSSIITFGDFKSSDNQLLDKAEAFYSKLNEGKKSGWLDDNLPSLDEDQLVWLNQNGEVQRMEKNNAREWINDDLVSLAISMGYWEDLSEEATKSIYYSADRAKLKFSYNPIDINNIKDELSKSIQIPVQENPLPIPLSEDNILSISHAAIFEAILKNAPNNSIKVAIDNLQNGDINKFNDLVQSSKELDFDSTTTKLLIGLKEYFFADCNGFTSRYKELMNMKELKLEKAQFNSTAEALFEHTIKEMVLALGISLALEKEKQSLQFNSFIQGLKVGAMSSIVGGKNKALRNTIGAAGFAISMTEVYSKLKGFRKIAEFRNIIESKSLLLDALNEDFNLMDTTYDLNELFENEMDDKIITIPFIASKMSNYESVTLLSFYNKPYLPNGNHIFSNRLKEYIQKIERKKPTLMSWASIVLGFIFTFYSFFILELLLVSFISFWFFVYFVPFGKRSFLRVKF